MPSNKLKSVDARNSYISGHLEYVVKYYDIGRPHLFVIDKSRFGNTFYDIIDNQEFDIIWDWYVVDGSILDKVYVDKLIYPKTVASILYEVGIARV